MKFLLRLNPDLSRCPPQKVLFEFKRKVPKFRSVISDNFREAASLIRKITAPLVIERITANEDGSSVIFYELVEEINKGHSFNLNFFRTPIAT